MFVNDNTGHAFRSTGRFNHTIITNIFSKYSFVHIKEFAVVINIDCFKMMYSSRNIQCSCAACQRL
jgi:hypothetical protein